MIRSLFLRHRLMDETTGGDAGGAGGGAIEAPAATPAAAPVPADLSIDTPPVVAPAAATAPVVYEPTGDAGLDLALDFVGNLGFGPDHAAIKAAEAGDFGPLKEALAKLGDKAKGWEKILAVGESAAKTKADAAAAQVARDQAMIHDAVGGEARWQEIAGWARENAEPAEKAAVNAALKAGGIAAKAMVLYLNHLYGKQTGTTNVPADAVKPSANGANPAPNMPLTQVQFAKEVQTLRRTLGPAFESSPQYRAIAQQRLNGVRQGI